jgi:hypothetical protein
MARLVSVKVLSIANFRVASVGVTGFALGIFAGLSMSLRADPPMQEQTAPAAPKAPATNAPPALPPDTFGEYGKIVAPSDQTAHPLKLKMPFPGVGEVKIPSADEMKMREKLEELAKLSDNDIRAQLEKWPAYGKMNLRDQGTMLQRIQDFRDYRSSVAKGKAHDIGLLTLLPDQQVRFEKDYWDKRLQMDQELAKQFEPIFKAREQKMRDELYREFSSTSPGPVADAAKPPDPGATAATNAAPAMPMAQAPH